MLADRLSVYIITAAVPGLGRDHLDVARAAVSAGATAVQLRDKGMHARDLTALARAIGEICRPAGVLFLVNDRVDVAIAAGADGAHLGQEDLPVPAARALLGRTGVLGVSAATPEEARDAEAAGADYLGVGAVFATASKADAGDPIGLAGLEAVRRSTALPVVAIGGITADNAAAVIAAGADGVAVMSAVTAARDMVAAVRALRLAVERARAAKE